MRRRCLRVALRHSRTMYVPHDRKQNAAREGRDTARNDADDDKELRAELESGCSAHFESRGGSKGVVL